MSDKLNNIEEALKVNLIRVILVTSNDIMKNPGSMEEKMNATLATDIVRMSRTHTKYIQFKLFKEFVET